MKEPVKEPVWNSDHYAHFYLKSFNAAFSDEDTSRETAFILKALQCRPGERLLDVCCGHGRHALALARQGYRVIGVDINRHFIELARTAAKGLDGSGSRDNAGGADGAGGASNAGGSGSVDGAGSTLFEVGDVAELSYDAEFSAAYFIASLGWVEDDDETLRILTSIKKTLDPEGRLLLDVTNRERVVSRGAVRNWTEIEGMVVVRKGDVDLNSSRYIGTETYIMPDGTRRTFNHSARLYTATELGTLLCQAGFQVIQTYGDYDLEAPYSASSPRLVLLADTAGR